jgi:hypothetical protein
LRFHYPSQRQMMEKRFAFSKLHENDFTFKYFAKNSWRNGGRGGERKPIITGTSAQTHSRQSFTGR